MGLTYVTVYAENPPNISFQFSLVLDKKNEGYVLPDNSKTILIDSVWWQEEYLGRLLINENELNVIEWFHPTDGKIRKYGISETDLLTVPIRLRQPIKIITGGLVAYELVISDI